MWLGWSDTAAEQARAIVEAVQRQAAGEPGAFAHAVLMEAARQDRELIAGIAAYRRHPWRRDLPAPPVLWTEGGSRLLHGRTLAVAAAQRRPDLVAALALLATPWDFHAAGPERATQLARLAPLLEPAMVSANTLPLAAPVARECLTGWYGANKPARGTWTVAGLAVSPAALDLPCFVAVPARDRIVPPESARPLAMRIRDAVLHEPAVGHIGMVAGARAEAALWRPLLAWVRGL